MSTEVGSSLPESLHAFLSDPRDPERARQVLLVSTLDEDGWPRHAMLSPREVVARSPSRLLALLYDDSRSSRNLRRDGRLSLIVVNPELSYYVFASARVGEPIPEAPRETLFELSVERVVEDVLPTARIVSGLTYEGHDPEAPPEQRARVIERLLSR